MLSKTTFNYGNNRRNGTAAWFDAETFGQDKLVTHYTLRFWTPGQSLDCIEELPISAEAKDQLKSLYTDRRNVLAGKSEAEFDAYLSAISYPDFLRQHGGIHYQKARPELQLATMIALADFTSDNGATCVVPGSHR